MEKGLLTSWEKPRRGGIFSLFAFLSLGAALLLFPGNVRDSVTRSILYCLTVLTPSLFPFMVVTSYGINSAAAEILGRWLGFLPRFLFRLPPVCAAPVFMSFVGGYPAGARGASLLLEQGKITKEQAGRMMLFCVNPGAAFVVTFLGGGVLGDFQTGWRLFFAVTLSGLLLGLLSTIGADIPGKSPQADTPPPTGALIRSVTDASRSVLAMCACIVSFSGFTAILHGSGIYQSICRILAAPGIFTPMEAASLLSFFLEVTGGAGVASQFRVGPAFYAFGLGFGGLCVHLQVFSFFRDFPAKRWKFLLFRFLHGVLAAGCYSLLAKFLPESPAGILSAAGTVQKVSGLSGTLAGGLSLFLMCSAFLLIVFQRDEGNESSRNKPIVVNSKQK